jgi:copper(I)-binding protein
MRLPVLLTALGLIAAAPLALADPAPVKAGHIVITQRVVRATFGQAPNTAAYMVLTNRGGAPDRLISASCACAAKAEAHLSQQRGGIMSMTAAGPVVIPAHGMVAFRPGGLHLMLTGLKTRLADGGEQPITLVFEHAGAVKADFAVKAQIPSAGAPMAMP